MVATEMEEVTKLKIYVVIFKIVIVETTFFLKQ